MNNIRVLVKEPGKPAEVREIENTLKAVQDIVGGHIEALQINDDVACFMREEGKLLGLAPNIVVPTGEADIFDVICGPVIFFRTDDEGELVDLTFTDIIFAIDVCVNYDVTNRLSGIRRLAQFYTDYT